MIQRDRAIACKFMKNSQHETMNLSFTNENVRRKSRMILMNIVDAKVNQDNCSEH